MDTQKFNNFFNPGNKLHACILTDTIKMFFHYNIANRKKFAISNKKQMASFFADMCVYIKNKHYHRYGTIDGVRYALEKSLGISDYTSLVEILAGNESALKAAKYPTNLFVGCSSKRSRKSKAVHNGIKVTGYTDAKQCKDVKRSIAIRSKFGNFPVMFFEISGIMDGSSAEVVAAKMEYHYQTGCPYYETRPMLLSNWMETDSYKHLKLPTTK